jgi:hypothetical protein
VFSTEPITAMSVPEATMLDGAIPITDKWKSEWNKPVQVSSAQLCWTVH